MEVRAREGEGRSAKQRGESKARRSRPRQPGEKEEREGDGEREGEGERGRLLCPLRTPCSPFGSRPPNPAVLGKKDQQSKAQRSTSTARDIDAVRAKKKKKKG